MILASLLFGAGALWAPAGAHAAWKLERSTPALGLLSMDVDPGGQQVVVYDEGSGSKGYRQYAQSGGALNSWAPSNIPLAVAYEGANVLGLEYENLGPSGLVRYNRAGAELGQLVITDPTPPPGPGIFPFATTLDVDSRSDAYVGYTDVGDDDLYGVQRINQGGARTAYWEAPKGSEAGHFDEIPAIASGGGGTVYTAEANRVQAFTDSGAYLRQWGQLGGGPGQFTAPTAIAVDGNGDVWVGDTPGGQRLQHFRADGSFVEQILLPTDLSTVVVGIGFDSAGRLYAATGPELRPGGIYVYGPASTSGPPAGNPGGGGGGSPVGRAAAISKSLRYGGGKIPVRIACRGEAKCRGSIVIRRQKLTLGSARYAIAAGKSAAVKVKVRRKAKRVLAASPQRSFEVKLELRPKGGSKSVTSATLTLPASPK